MTRLFDPVNSPEHYCASGKIECIEAIEAQLTQEEYRGFLKANCAKYIWRERLKGGTESLKKARWYLDALIQLDESQNNAECKDGFCPMPDIRYDMPLPGGMADDTILFQPIS